jgi:hypothetical protein
MIKSSSEIIIESVSMNFFTDSLIVFQNLTRPPVLNSVVSSSETSLVPRQHQPDPPWNPEAMGALLGSVRLGFLQL